MILVADSGSTKCDWVLIQEGQRLTAQTMGFNPFFHSTEFIYSKLEENDILGKHRGQVKEIYFYGAGCSNTERNLILKDALSRYFVSQNKLIVEEDLYGAAYATCDQREGIVCILGTGSNSCYYDGHRVHANTPALGYILGDEGSGSYFGKKLITQYLYRQLPASLAEEFERQNDVSTESILSTIYNRPHANVYLAHFMKFIAAHRDHPYIIQMMYEGIKHFAEIHILSHPQTKEVPVHFVGSVAYYFSDAVKTVADELGFKVGKVIQKPIMALANYHSSPINADLGYS